MSDLGASFIALGLLTVSWALAEIANAIRETMFVVKLPETVNVTNNIRNDAANQNEM